MKLVLISFLLFFSGNCFSQADTVAKVQPVIGLQFRSGETIAHTMAALPIKGAKPFGLELQLARRKTSFDSWNKTGAFITTGFAINYFDFNLSLLGRGAAVSYFIQPEYGLGNRLTAYYRAGIGLDYLSNPSDPIENPANRTYSQHINPYMNVGIGLNVRVTHQFSLTINGAFHHTSNGEFKKPNTGINWVTAGAGLVYSPDGNDLPKYKRNRKLRYTSRKIAVDAGIFYTPPQGYNPQRVSQRNFIGGVTVQATKAFTNTNAITAGISAYYMHYRIDAPNSMVDNSSPVMTGIHVGHAFLMGPVRFSQQIGIYLVKPAHFIPDVYQQYDFSYLFGRHLQLGVGLRANADNADFSDFKILYRF